MGMTVRLVARGVRECRQAGSNRWMRERERDRDTITNKQARKEGWKEELEQYAERTHIHIHVQSAEEGAALHGQLQGEVRTLGQLEGAQQAAEHDEHSVRVVELPGCQRQVRLVDLVYFRIGELIEPRNIHIHQ